MRMIHKTSLAVGAVLFVASGCLVEREWREPVEPSAPTGSYFDDDDEDDGWDDECWDCGAIEPTFTVEQGRVGGDIGVFRDLDLTVDTPSSYEDPSYGYTNINLTGYDESGDIGMIILDLMNVTVGELPEGSSECHYDGGSGTQIMVTGCASGDSEDEYYDAPASDCEVTVEHTPEGTDVSVLATLPSFDDSGNQDGSTIATAHFLAAPLE